jgi:hypothetical protein
MPSKSAKQAKFMAAAANSPEFAKKVGISQGTAREFHTKDRKKRFAEGGEAPAVNPRRSTVKDEGRPLRNYDPFEELRRQYQTPGTVIRGDELPNSRPSSTPNRDQQMRNQPVKKMAKGGKAGCGPMKKYAEGGQAKKMAQPMDRPSGYAAGGKVCRGMGAAVRGGKYCG